MTKESIARLSAFVLEALIERVAKVAILGGVAVILVASTGCVEVAPYERAKLAHPTMAASDWTGAGEAHLRAISEGATGGSGGTGSGCGCN